ncbi:O-antigen acetylase [alpha proteobacterium U9-1i]|nr:O-antigen acetylase [alpha proteobacterium U9-1i]
MSGAQSSVADSIGRAEIGYRADIDGLRAIAVGAVVLYHAGLAFVPSGYVGVDIFFVISGYLIGGIILREVGAGNFSFLAFYARRARRILPALFAVVVGACLLGLLLLNAEDLKNLGTSAAAALTAVSNFKFWLRTDYFAPEAHFDPMLMTWSLGVEEQFYVLFPFLLLGIGRFSPRNRIVVLMILIAASFAVALVMLRFDPQGAFYLLPARAWELGIGALLAALHLAPGRAKLTGWKRDAQGALGLALLIVSVAAFDATTPFPGLAALAPVAGTALLIDAQGSFVNRRLLAAAPLVFVGLVSYSWYLWHWPMMTFVRHASTFAPSLVSMLGAGALAFVLAIASWWWIERPFRARVLPAPKVLFHYAAAGVAVLAATLALRLSNGAPQRLPEATRAIEVAIADGRGACLLGFGENLRADSNCRPATNGTPAFALIGDSHAASLEPGLRALAEGRNARLVHYTKSACPPLLGVTYHLSSRPTQRDECDRFIRAALADIAARDDIRIVLVAGLWTIGSWDDGNYLSRAEGASARLEPRRGLEEGLGALINALQASGKEVVVFADVPNLTFDAPRRATTEAMSARALLASVVDRETGVGDGVVRRARMQPLTFETNSIIREIAAAHPNVGFVDFEPTFCNADACRYVDEGQLLYFDNAHLTRAGAVFALEPVQRQWVGAPEAAFQGAAWGRP